MDLTIQLLEIYFKKINNVTTSKYAHCRFVYRIGHRKKYLKLLPHNGIYATIKTGIYRIFNDYRKMFTLY